MKEVIRREKVAGIIPEADVDTYMKVNNYVSLFSSLNESDKHTAYIYRLYLLKD